MNEIFVLFLVVESESEEPYAFILKKKKDCYLIVSQKKSDLVFSQRATRDDGGFSTNRVVVKAICNSSPVNLAILAFN